jgi:hypothetical protein
MKRKLHRWKGHVTKVCKNNFFMELTDRTTGRVSEVDLDIAQVRDKDREYLVDGAYCYLVIIVHRFENKFIDLLYDLPVLFDIFYFFVKRIHAPKLFIRFNKRKWTQEDIDRAAETGKFYADLFSQV